MSPNFRVARALAGREARRVLLHPATITGLVLAGLGFFAVLVEDESADALFDSGNSFGLPLFLLALALVVSANLCALRSRRERTEELFTSLPTSPATRTTAQAVASLAGVVLVALILGATLTLWHLRPGTIGLPRFEVVASVLLITAGGVLTGVLLARWIPYTIAGVLGVIALILLQANLGQNDATWRWLHFGPGKAYGGIFDVGPFRWHVVYLVGLVLLAGAVAVARHGLSRPVTILLVAAVGVSTTAAWAQTRPLGTSELASAAARLTDLPSHQVCERHDGVRFCAYPEYRGWMELWRSPVAGVLARVPLSARARVADVRQRARRDVELLPGLRSRVDPAAAWPADGEVHPGLAWFLGPHDIGLGYQTAARTMGLPTVLGPGERPCSVGGQARGVVAVWLAGQSTPAARSELAERAKNVGKGGELALAQLYPLDVEPDYENKYETEGGDYIPELASAARGADVVAAAALLGEPSGRVAGVLATEWGRLTRSETSAVELFSFLGRPAPPELAGSTPVVAGLGAGCS